MTTKFKTTTDPEIYEAADRECGFEPGHDYSDQMEVPIIPKLYSTILNIIESGEGRLVMRDWHTCGTTHCIAGWAVNLAGKQGNELENVHGTEYAGALIFKAAYPNQQIPDFFTDNLTAMESLRERAKLDSPQET